MSRAAPRGHARSVPRGKVARVGRHGTHRPDIGVLRPDRGEETADAVALSLIRRAVHGKLLLYRPNFGQSTWSPVKLKRLILSPQRGSSLQAHAFSSVFAHIFSRMNA